MEILSAAMALKPDEMGKMKDALGDKLILNLSKYIFAAFDLISQQDQAVIKMCQNGQHLLKV